jgi:hypothetical protein
MEGLLSTAIGLSGTPKDYTALQAARERQKGVEQQRKQLARDKELDELRKGLVVKDGFYLPGRYEDVERYTAEAYDNMVKAYDSGDRRALATMQTQFLNTMNVLSQERKQVDDLEKMNGRVAALEQWKWYVIGGAATIGFILGNLSHILKFLQ